MKKLIFILLLVTGCIATKAQTNWNKEFDSLKRYVVCIGYVDTNRFIEVGSGITTYVMCDTQPMTMIITAKHVVDFFVKNRLRSFCIRFWYADTLKTSVYFGIDVPLKNDIYNNFFVSKDNDLDIACIFLNGNDERISPDGRKIKVFPLGRIVNPGIADNVYIFGYPGHVENVFNKYDFSVCTVKNGFVSWVPQTSINSTIDNYILVEANISYGNSGGPVFLLGQDGSPKLVGIAQSVFLEPIELKFDDSIVRDPTSKKSYYVTPRSGVCKIVRADRVRSFLESIKTEMEFIMHHSVIKKFN
jgi:S1-C subfamily serine protease